MVHVEASGKRPSPILPGALMAAALCLLTACGGGSSSAPYFTTAPASGGSGSGGGSGGGSGSGGGGATGAASPYVLFASTYLAYAAQTNGAYLHSAQGGDVYTGQGGSWFFSQTNGGYSAPQSAMNSTGLYIFQEKAGAAPTTAGDYVYVAVSAPGNGTTDISQASTLLIQMGNSVTPGAAVGNAHVFTVDLNNAKGSTAATVDCSYDVTLSEIGAGVAGPPGSALGVRTYAIPLASPTTCAVGSASTLLSTGITTVAVKITGDKNPQLAAGEIDNINIGMIGFTGTISSGDASTLSTQ